LNATVLFKSVDIDIPGYRIIRPVGEGGMASVFLAVQKSLEREVALKVMSPVLAANSEFASRFLIEGKITAKLQHPNLVTVYDIGSHNGIYYLAAEYIPGGTLKDKVTSGGLNVGEMLDIVSDIAHGLDFAHQKGFVHRDVKPGNVLFRNDGRVVLADFGIAKAMDGSNSSTVAGSSIGTPDYMSPEQARGETVDGRSDLYALGVVLFELLVGHPPYQASDPFTVALMHVTHPVPELPEQHQWLQPLIHGLMAKQPAERYNTGAAFVEAMHQLLATAPQGATLHEARAAKPGANTRIAGSNATQQRTRVNVGQSGEKPAWIKPATIGGAAVVLAIAGYLFFGRGDVADPNAGTGTTQTQPGGTTLPETLPEGIRVPQSIDAGVAQIQTLLAQADTYKKYAFEHPEEGGRGLWYPTDDNAIDLYLKVLDYEPNNVAAKAGLGEIADWVYDRAYKICYTNRMWVACRQIAEHGIKAESEHAGLRDLVSDAAEGERGAEVALRDKWQRGR